MAISMRIISVNQLPEKLSGKQGRLFLEQMQQVTKSDRPRIVLDCSHLHELDRQALHILLCILEGAMKHNGDVKLAAVPPGVQAFLEITGASRVFESYATISDAENSFHRVPGVGASHKLPTGHAEQVA